MNLLAIMLAPLSWYSFLDSHICLNVLNELITDPPSHAEYPLLLGALTSTFIPDGAIAFDSFASLSCIPGNNVQAPVSTMLESNCFLNDSSHIDMELMMNCCSPSSTFPRAT